MKILVLIMSVLFCLGCASQSAKMAHKINNDTNNKYDTRKTNDCNTMLAKQEKEDLIFNSRIIATPLIGVLGFIAAPAILAANLSLDVKDRLVASEMSEKCGGSAIKKSKIAGDVAINGTLGLLLQGSNISIYPGGEEVPISTAAEASTN